MTDKFNTTKYLHFLLDYDGLIVDSEKLYLETWSLLLTRKGRKVCSRYHEGRHESEVYEKVKLYLKNPMSLEEVSNYRKLAFDKLVTQGRLELVDGMKELLERMKSIAPISVVSNSIREIVEDGLSSVGLEGYFNNLFCFSDEVNRKPSPDLYNLAISELSLDRNNALAFEDSGSGVLAALEAQVPVVCISSNPLMKNFCKKYCVKYFKSAKEYLSTLE